MTWWPTDYDEQVYAGLLGKVIGVQYGGPIEGWTDDRIWETYGELFGIMGFANAPLPSRLAVRTLGRFMVKDAISRAGARRALASPRDYFAALERRDGLARALDGFLDEHDAWLLPVSSSPAFPHRKTGDIHHPVDVDGEEVPGNLAGTGYTCPFNLTGHPAVAVPLGTSGDGLPIGVQVVGRRWGEMALLDVAEALTGITGAFRRPPGS